MNTSTLTWTTCLALLTLQTVPAMAAAPAPPPPVTAPAPLPDASADVARRLDEARERLQAAVREVTELSTQLGSEKRDVMFFRTFGSGVLGLQIDNDRNGGGVRVMNVSPGGAAAEAGMRSGDVITALDGRDITKSEHAGRELLDYVRALPPGTKAKLAYRRDGRTQDVLIEPRALAINTAYGMGAMPHVGALPPLPALPGSGISGHVEGPMFEARFGALAGLELANVSPRLGSYFGAKQGVLVVRAGDSQFKLEDGDVILAIDGREPANAAHATRILRSYQRGEKISIKALRDKRNVTLESTSSQD